MNNDATVMVHNLDYNYYRKMKFGVFKTVISNLKVLYAVEYDWLVVKTVDGGNHTTTTWNISPIN